jgi:YD repeat-containing protein
MRPDGRVSSETSARGLTTVFTYDGPGGRLSGVTDGYGHTVTFQYEGYGTGQYRLWKILDPQNHETRFSYNATSGCLESITDPEAKTQSFGYQAIEYTDSDNVEHVLRRMTTETLKNGNAFTCDYSDMVGSMSRTIRDSQGQVIVSIAAPSFPMVRREQVIEDDNTVVMTDGRAYEWTYQRDIWQRLTQVRTPPEDVGGSEPLYYYALAEYGADPDEPGEYNHLLRTRSWDLSYLPESGGPFRVFEWNGMGLLASVTDEEGHSTSYVYDPNDPLYPGLLRQKIEPSGKTWEYTYDPATGDLTGEWDPIKESTDPQEDEHRTFAYEYYGENYEVPSGSPARPGRIHGGASK